MGTGPSGNNPRLLSPINCDVLIIGAGPAGSTAARAAAQSGAEVIMVDRRAKIGVPPQCAGHVPLAAAGLIPSICETVVNRVGTMLIFTPDGRVEKTDSRGYVIRRDLFDRALATAAEAAGATIITQTRAISHIAGVTTLRTPGGYVEINSAITIGADGPSSTVGSWFGSVNKSCVIGAQWTVPLRRPLRETRVYFNQRFPGGYGWLFPCNGQANVGVGVVKGVGVKGVGVKGIGVKAVDALKWFVGKLAGDDLVEAMPLQITGGLIPIGGPLKNHGSDLLLAGDAAGLCHPVSGAGIAAALLSGRLAGEAAAGFILGSGREALAAYADEIETVFGESLRNAAARRRSMYENRELSEREFCRAVRQGWITPPLKSILSYK